MSFLSNFIKKAAPIVAAVSPEPISRTAATAITIGQQQQEAEYQKKLAEDSRAKQQRRINQMALQSQQGQYGDFYVPPSAPRQTTNAGFGSSFGSFLSDVGSNIVSPLSNIFSSVRPFFSQQSAGQPALATRTTLGGQESAQSGTTEAFMGGFGNLAGQAARFLRTPTGSIGTGLLTGIGGSMLSSGGGGMRITRKMKSQYRAVLNLAQGDYDLAASMIGVSTDQFIMVLLKRFRNDGPVVTKAALRKTKTTVRRLKSMCDMYDSLRPTATRRKAPMRRASTTLISNK